MSNRIGTPLFGL